MKKTPAIKVKEGSYALLGYLTQMGLAFASFLVLVRLLPSEEFGVWVLFLTLTSLAEMARVGLIQNGLIKFVAGNPDQAGQIQTAGLVLNTVSGQLLAWGLVVLSIPLGRLWAAPELAALMWWYPLLVLPYGTARLLDFFNMCRSDFKGIFFSKLIYGLTFLLLVAGAYYRYGALELIWLPGFQLVGAVLSLVVMLSYRPDYRMWGALRWKWFRQLFQFGKYVMGTNAGSMLFNRMDLLMIGALLTPSAVALYNVASRLTNYVEIPLSSLSQVIYPKLAAAREGDVQELALLYERSTALLLGVLLPPTILVILFSQPLLKLLAGPEYVAAAPVLNVLMLAVLIKPWGRMFGITLDALGHPGLNFRLLLGALVLNIVLNLCLVPAFGIIGAAWATFLSMAAGIIAGQTILGRLLPVQQVNILKDIWSFYRRPSHLITLNKFQ